MLKAQSYVVSRRPDPNDFLRLNLRIWLLKVAKVSDWSSHLSLSPTGENMTWSGCNGTCYFTPGDRSANRKEL
jgi:hypothetical protein